MPSHRDSEMSLRPTSAWRVSPSVTPPHARRPPSPTLPRKGGEGRTERFPGGAARLCLSPPLEGGPKARSAFGEGVLFEAGKVRVGCRAALPSPGAATPPQIRRGGFGPPARGGITLCQAIAELFIARSYALAVLFPTPLAIGMSNLGRNLSWSPLLYERAIEAGLVGGSGTCIDVV